MKEAHVTCDCGAVYKGIGHDDWEAVTKANRKRSRCRDRNPQDHAEARRLARDFGPVTNQNALREAI